MTDNLGRIAGDRLPRWVPLTMALVGLVGAVAASQLAVAANDDDSSLEAGSPALVSQETSTSLAGTTVVTSVEPEAGKGDAATDSTDDAPSSTSPPETEIDRDCPPLFVVFFPLGSAEPQDDLRREADELAAWLGRHLDTELLLNGHADAAGSEQANLRLSFRRAEAAAEILAQAGVPSGQLQLRGFGEYQPVLGVSPDSKQNRRVTMEIPEMDDCAASDGEKDANQ